MKDNGVDEDNDGDSDSDGCYYEGCYYGYVVDGDDSDNYCTIDRYTGVDD